MDLDLRRFAPSLTRDETGVWVAAGNGAISYPSDGNAACFEVEERSFWFQHRNAVIVSVMGRLPPPGGMVFDVGGGNGFVARALQAAGWVTTVVEPGPVGAANARRASGVSNVVCARLEDTGFTRGSLPAVGLFDVVEHFADDAQLLNDVRDLLAPEGRMYVTVPAYRWLWSTEDDDAGHFRRYTTRSLASTLRAAGLTVEFVSYFFAMLPLPIFLLRSIPSRLRLRRKVTSEQTLQEHAGRGTQSGFMNALLQRERRRLAAGKRLSFGSSIVAVARKSS
jgi:2-polyprenyl-3-methyl-5-hydroxy-6-metoxy-1,4-benzoquinol methylase